MMRGTWLIMPVAVLALIAFDAHAQPGGISPAAAAERQHISILRHSVRIIQTRKCLPPRWRPYVWPNVADIPRSRLYEVRRAWQLRERRVHRSSSRCIAPARARMLRHWFRTSGAACVKAHEGAWTDPDPLYYGGFQADLNFQRAYGLRHLRRWGTANHWPPIAQIDMAHRGWQARGWHPWPTTARICGLL